MLACSCYPSPPSQISRSMHLDALPCSIVGCPGMFWPELLRISPLVVSVHSRPDHSAVRFDQPLSPPSELSPLAVSKRKLCMLLSAGAAFGCRFGPKSYAIKTLYVSHGRPGRETRAQHQ